MSVHAYHPDTHTHGLADDCARCAEHAANPRASLDQINLTMLRIRIENDLPARSGNEATAMINLQRAA